MIGSLLTETIHPFGRDGAANTTGAIYGASVSTAGSTSFITVEEITVEMPSNAIITELEYGLTVGLRLTVTTDSPLVKYLIKDNAQSTYDTTASFTSTTLAAVVSTTTLVDFTCYRTVTPSSGTLFSGKGNFQVACQIASNASTSNVIGGVKQGSYLYYSYRLIA